MTISPADLQQQLDTLRQAYLKRLQQDLPLLLQLAQALPDTPADSWQQQATELATKLHTLAGSAGTFGFARLGGNAKLAEQQLKQWLDKDAKPDADSYSSFIATITRLNRLDETDAAATAADAAIAPEPVAAIIYLCCADKALQEQIRVMLDIFGYANRQFADFNALRAAIVLQRPAVVIADADQQDAVAQLQIIQNEQATMLPLLLVSANTDFNSYLNAVRIGAIGYYSRPLNTTELEAGVRKQLSVAERVPFRVMLVDDDQMLAQHYALVLQQGGLMVEILPQPAHIFEALNRFHPDVILLDVNMPFCTGPELAQLVRLQHSWLGVPIIYLSSETDSEQQLAALIKAGDDFITKPISDTALLVAVFASLPFIANEQRFFCSFSAGISVITGCNNADVVIEKADQALYKAKTSGRNRVTLAPSAL